MRLADRAENYVINSSPICPSPEHKGSRALLANAATPPLADPPVGSPITTHSPALASPSPHLQQQIDAGTCDNEETHESEDFSPETIANWEKISKQKISSNNKQITVHQPCNEITAPVTAPSNNINVTQDDQNNNLQTNHVTLAPNNNQPNNEATDVAPINQGANASNDNTSATVAIPINQGASTSRGHGAPQGTYRVGNTIYRVMPFDATLPCTEQHCDSDFQILDWFTAKAHSLDT